MGRRAGASDLGVDHARARVDIADYIVALDRIVSSVPEKSRGNTEFFAGWLLKNHEVPHVARKYFQHCTGSPNTLNWHWFVASDALKLMTEGSRVVGVAPIQRPAVS